MALYVYITEECERDAKKHNRYDEMMRLKAKVESSQSMSHFDNFPPPYLKKRFDRQIRLLADYRTRTINGEDHVVVSFIRIYVRSSKEYASFLKDSLGFGDKHLSPLVDIALVDDHLKEQLAVNPVSPKDAPSADEYEFLYRSFGGGDDSTSSDEFICESEHWVRKVSDQKIKQILVLICDVLPSLVGSDSAGKRVKIRNHTLVCRWFPNLKKLFLAGISDAEEELAAIERDYVDVLAPSEPDVSEETILKRSMRTYTATLVVDEEGWINVQNDSESNLALSPEETRVLESVHNHEKGFPVFINGRAGSGKSTILYYLFADYINLYMDLREKGSILHHPMIFSCSEDLTRRALATVLNLIKCNPRWSKEGQTAPAIPADAFQEFHRYLLSLVPLQERALFPEDQFIDYAKFRRLWEKQFGNEPQMRKEAGPDLSWHIIRSYIKGTSPEEYLEPEEYEHLPRKQKSVSQKAYELVFSKVWESWYKERCESRGYWDDQDLARHVFANDLVQSVIPAVFCDESQDFTRVELDILFRLCLFVDRTLGHDDITRVPFAFAGDPFQTLNPTGFRWDAIQASFHDKLSDTLGENIRRDIEINYQELNLNYRSTENIVRFCNLIQSMRASLFELPKLSPQETWQFEVNSPFPVWFDRDNKMLWNTLKDEPDITIIIPCALNEEVEFVANDEALRQIVRHDDKNVPQNVLSPARAKGLEFGRVVLYAFADNAPNDLLSILDENEHDLDALLPFEYFVNQLYVGASRPKKRLFIIDSQKGRNQLWKITSDDVQQKMWSRIHKGSVVWKDAVGGFQIGTKDSWSEDRGNTEEIAYQYEQQGLALRDPYLLRSAAMTYENIGQSNNATKCRAEALRFEEQFLDAGDCFSNLGDADQALSCYWKEGLRSEKKVMQLGKQFPDIITRIEYKLLYTSSDPNPTAIANIMQVLREQVADIEAFSNRLKLEDAFSAVIWELASFCLKFDSSDFIVQTVIHLEELLATGIKTNHLVMGDLYYKVKNMEKAVDNWDKDTKSQNRSEYRRAKAIVLSNSFKNNPSIELSQSDAVAVSGHFIEQNEFRLAIKSLALRGTVSDLVNSLSKVPITEKVLPELLVDVVNILTARLEWDAVINIAHTSSGSDPKGISKPISKLLVRHTSVIRNAVAMSCSESEELVKLDNNMLGRYSDYFLKVFCKASDWKREIPLEFAGAAIERAGRQKDILPFYEKVWADNFFNKKDRDFAKKRWIVTKEKQAAREEDSGRKTDAKKYMNAASERRREIGATEASLPDYPVISGELKQWNGLPSSLNREFPTLTAEEEPVPEVTQANTVTVETSKTPVQPSVKTAPQIVLSKDLKDSRILLGDLRFEFSPSRGRVNITNEESMGQASFRTEKNALCSTDIDVVNIGHGTFSCPDWALECVVLDADGTTEVSFAIKDSGVSLVLNFPTKVSATK